MHVVFLNPQGNFDPLDSHWAEHPDFGGQLVYVKETALAMAALGHQVDIATRRILDPAWPEFAAPVDHYPGAAGVRILRLPCGPPGFLAKESLWPYLGTEWVPNLVAHFQAEGRLPDALTAQYADGGLSAVLLSQIWRVPFTFTAHSLGAQKMDKLGVRRDNLAELDNRFKFTRRILAERASMSHAGRVITSTHQERMEQYGHPAYAGAVDPSDDARFAVVPPGVNLRLFSPEPGAEDGPVGDRIQAALDRDLAPGRRHLPFVVCSSRLDPKKNHLGLVLAFAQSPALQEVANLAIVARGLDDPLRNHATLRPPERAILDGITALMDTYELWGKVVAFPLDSQAELAAAYRIFSSSRSVFALTALYEPFGLAPLEAMSCGLPVVVTRNGGPSESLQEGERSFGVLVDPTDPLDIARGLLGVVRSSAQAWEARQQAGRARVLACYTWDRTAQGYLAELENLARAPTAPGSEPVPRYFTHPSPEHDIPADELARLYFGRNQGEGDE